MNFCDKISKVIKEGKWLNIFYLNKSGEKTYYWIAIKDVDLSSKRLYVTMSDINAKKLIEDIYHYDIKKLAIRFII